MKTRLLFAAGILLVSASLLADGLVKFKGWDNSPQGYFMTKAERQQWAAVRTDDEAQTFVDHFLASRGPAFAADVAARAEQADKHLTIDKTKIQGSKTLRGKLVILLGPPDKSFDVSELTDRGSVHHDNPAMGAAMSGGTASSPGVDDGNEGARSMGAASVTEQYHFAYTNTPSGPLEVMILADPNTGKDRPKGRDDTKKLDIVFEAAAQASIKTK